MAHRQECLGYWIDCSFAEKGKTVRVRLGDKPQTSKLVMPMMIGNFSRIKCVGELKKFSKGALFRHIHALFNGRCKTSVRKPSLVLRPVLLVVVWCLAAKPGLVLKVWN